MKILKIEPDGFESNSYILTADGKTAVAIDPSGEGVLAALSLKNLVCEYVLLTHGHFDHVGMCGRLYQGGAQICCGEFEKDFIFSPQNSEIFGGVYIPQFKISKTFSDGEKFTLCGIDFTALHTPGHTAGSMCYIAGDFIFSGDTLFLRSVGRTDLPTGNTRELISSVKKLFALNGNYTVYTGHGDDTSLEFERRNNPYVR